MHQYTKWSTPINLSEIIRTLFGEVGAAIPLSVREVKIPKESEEAGKALSTKGEIVIEVKRSIDVLLLTAIVELAGS